ncbi:MAG: hypothetical protein ACJ72Q_09080 [Nitrososphaeraceae archaeon]
MLLYDPAQGKTAHLAVGGGTHGVVTTIPRDLFLPYFSNYSIFLLALDTFFDSVSFDILKSTKGEKSLL